MVSGSMKVQRNEDVVRTRLRNLDRFQICLAACRTSSASVRNENTYKDPLAKHCYAMQPMNSQQRHRRDVIVDALLNNNGDNPAVVVTSSSVVTLLIHFSYECHSLHRPSDESRVPFCVTFIPMLSDHYSSIYPP